MKKSNRYRTRYTPKKRALEKKLADCQEKQKYFRDLVASLNSSLREMSKRRVSLDDLSQAGYAVIKIGQEPHYSGSRISITLQIDTMSFRHSVDMRGGFFDLDREIRHYCMMLTDKIHTGLVEFMKAENIMR